MTLTVPLVLYALRELLAPGIDLDEDGMARLLGMRRLPSSSLSVMALGLAPILLAYLAVAPGAWIARVRARRRGEAPASRVGATLALATAFAVIAGWLQAGELVRASDGALDLSARWEIAAEMAGGCALFALGALAIDRWGLGRGWSAILALAAVSHALERTDRAPSAIALTAATLVATLTLVASRTRVVDARGSGVRLPLAGVIGAGAVPTVFALLLSPLLNLPALASLRADVYELAQPRYAIPIAAAIALGLGVAWTRALTGAGRLVAIGLSIAIAVGLAASERAMGGVTSLGLAAALIAAALADAAVEARARARGAWTATARIDDVDAADALLADAGERRFARGLHVRSLLRGLAPMIPIEIFEARDARRTE